MDRRHDNTVCELAEVEADLARVTAERDALRDIALALRQHLALFCGPDDAIAQALFVRADAVTCGAGATDTELAALRDRAERAEAEVERLREALQTLSNTASSNGWSAKRMRNLARAALNGEGDHG